MSIANSDNAPKPPARRPRISCSIWTVLATLLVFVVLTTIYNFVTGVAPAPDYPGATKSELTAEGNQFINSLYQNNKRENSTVKVFLTNDQPPQVLSFYNDQLVNKESFASGEKAIRQIAGAIVILFTKKDYNYALITSNQPDNLVKNQQPNQTYIIIAQGRG